jgi:hypothetical protein
VGRAGENIVKHIAGLDDFEIATAAYQAALTHWPQSRVILRQGARTVHDTAGRDRSLRNQKASTLQD